MLHPVCLTGIFDASALTGKEGFGVPMILQGPKYNLMDEIVKALTILGTSTVVSKVSVKKRNILFPFSVCIVMSGQRAVESLSLVDVNSKSM